MASLTQYLSRAELRIHLCHPGRSTGPWRTSATLSVTDTALAAEREADPLSSPPKVEYTWDERVCMNLQQESIISVWILQCSLQGIASLFATLPVSSRADLALRGKGRGARLVVNVKTWHVGCRKDLKSVRGLCLLLVTVYQGASCVLTLDLFPAPEQW